MKFEFYWGTHGGVELDLLIMRGNERIDLEFKRTVNPVITKSLRIAIEDLKLTKSFIVHAGENTFPLAKKITALSIQDIVARPPFE